jgi:hypothetical protein
MDPFIIKSVQFYKAVSTLSQSIVDETHKIPEIIFIIGEIELNSGIKGQDFAVNGGWVLKVY